MGTLGCIKAKMGRTPYYICKMPAGELIDRVGIAKEMPVEVIEYGNPDNSETGDLKGHNQVYLRGEAYIGWGILDPNAFAIITAGQISG